MKFNSVLSIFFAVFLLMAVFAPLEAILLKKALLGAGLLGAGVLGAGALAGGGLLAAGALSRAHHVHSSPVVYHQVQPVYYAAPIPYRYARSYSYYDC